MDRRKRSILVCLTLALIVGGCGSSATAHAPAPAPTSTPPTTYYSATLTTLNASGVTGTVTMALTGDEMAVTITLAGLIPNQPHMQHIHGAHGFVATCPTAASANADGIITLDAGTPAYGPVALPFEPTPTADASGKTTWSQRLRLTAENIFSAEPLTQHVVLIHGLNYKGVYDQVLPAACGPITAG